MFKPFGLATNRQQLGRAGAIGRREDEDINPGLEANRSVQPASPGVVSAILTSLRTPAGISAVAIAVGIATLYGSLWPKLLPLWLSEDGYYSHGFLVPVISGYVVYKWWPRLRETPVRTGWAALPFLLGLVWLSRVAHVMQIDAMMSIGLVATIVASVWFVAGGRWAALLSLPSAYLLFGLPLWSRLIQDYTNPLQILSTKVAYQILRVSGFAPNLFPDEPNVIYLNNFALNVAVPCSGLKLLLALSAFTAFFMMIAKLKLVGNLALAAILFPLALFVNGLRIALVGMVGDQMGHDAGVAFHDYSGYITLILCFFVLFKIAKGLGWKD